MIMPDKPFRVMHLLALIAMAMGIAGCGAKDLSTGNTDSQSRESQSSERESSEIQSPESLRAGFSSPPNEARPRVWWHWMNGNISKEGIKADIEWMSRVGIGGLQHFDAALNTPQIVGQRLIYMTPEWKAAFRYAAEQAQLHDLELAVASSPGWSETGGPWVKPEDGMKKIVWSEMVLSGGKRFQGPLPPLPRSTGIFQDIAALDELSSMDEAHESPEYGEDTLLLAYPLVGDGSVLPLPTMKSGDGTALDTTLLNDGLYQQTLSVLKGTPESPAVINIHYEQALTIRSLGLFIPGAAGLFSGQNVIPVFEAKRSDGSWQTLSEISISSVPTTASFPAVTAKQFRLLLKTAPPTNPFATMGTMAPGVDALSMMASFGASAGSSLAGAAGASSYQLAELSLQAEPRVDNFEQKAGFAISLDYYALDSRDTDKQPGEKQAGIKASEVINLTGRMTADGHLDWTPPAGQWKVIRMGYSLTGKINHPAPPEATGLEVDKFDGEAVRRYMEAYLANYRDATGDDLLGDKGLRALLTDSIEVGASNWTPAIIEHFKRLRGYDPLPWMPVLTGAVIGSREQSDAFLYDYRRTLGDLLVSQHYAEIAKITEAYGLTYYSEAQESIRSTLGDDMAMRTPADIPMSALWTYGDEGPKQVYGIDIKGAASVANIYGQNLVATESLTSLLQPWAYTPAQLQPMIDFAFANGTNRPVIHTSAHQPRDDKYPGLALLIFGQYFNRHEAWAEMAKPWVDYLSRTSYLLQQGRNYADVAYFYGEEAPLTTLFADGVPADAPEHYAFDFINADALLNATSVEGKELVTIGGARYKLLYLGGTSRQMTVPVLRRLAELVAAGVTVVGEAPERSPSLKDDPAEFSVLVKQLWGDGQIINQPDVETVLSSMGIAHDFSYAKAAEDSHIMFQHRHLPDGEIYFLSNRSKNNEDGEAHFRVIGKQPEIWRADSGESQPVSYRIEQGETVIPLNMQANDSFFVVFSKPANSNAFSYRAPAWKPVADIGDGEWQVSFQAGRGAPATISLPGLMPLNEHEESGVKYFSGIATYQKSFVLPESVSPGQALMLDLGAIGDVAEVFINDRLVGTVWREPHRIDIGEFVKTGQNSLTVRVANRWVNRLIGDAQPGAEQVTWTSTRVYLPSAPLLPSGLIGPVTLLEAY